MIRPCAYCGRRTKNKNGVCNAHSDLPKLDPYFNWKKLSEK